MIQNLKDLLDIDYSIKDEQEQLELAIKSIESDIEQELDIYQERVFFTYTRPERAAHLATPYGNVSKVMLKTMFSKEEIEEGKLAEFLEQHTLYSEVPRTTVMKLTSTESIRVLNLLRTIYKEKLQNLTPQ
jgi:hypothetical protein